jgi:hypothetical protein
MFFWYLGMTSAIVLFTLGRRRIDFRVVLLGSLLPNLIDVLIGRVFFARQFDSSRLFGHTLLLVLVLALGIQLALRGDTARRWFILPIAALLHLGLDGMWNHPITLFWPMFGPFPKMPVAGFWPAVLLRPFSHPIEGIKELVGLGWLVYLGFGFSLHKRVPRREFFRTGRLLPARGPAEMN